MVIELWGGPFDGETRELDDTIANELRITHATYDTTTWSAAMMGKIPTVRVSVYRKSGNPLRYIWQGYGD